MLSMEGVDWRARASSAARSWSWKVLRRLVVLGKGIPGRWEDIVAAAAAGVEVSRRRCAVALCWESRRAVRERFWRSCRIWDLGRA
jgi:hypothetical protein